MLTKLLLGAGIGAAIFFLIRQSRTVGFIDGELVVLEEIDLSSFPQRIDADLLPVKITIQRDAVTTVF